MCMRRCAPNIMAAASSCRPRLHGARVLDLGSGSGRDVYLISQLVGPEGEVVGVDMTDEQLATANAHIDWHMRRFGYARRNVRFLKGYIEKLGELGLAARELRRGRVELRDQSLGRQARGAARRLRSAQARAASSISPMSIATGASATRSGPIPCSTASALAARSTGTTFCRWPSRRASSIRGW